MLNLSKVFTSTKLRKQLTLKFPRMEAGERKEEKKERVKERNEMKEETKGRKERRAVEMFKFSKKEGGKKEK